MSRLLQGFVTAPQEGKCHNGNFYISCIYCISISIELHLHSSTDQCAGSADVKRNASLGLNSNVPLIGMTGTLTAACSEY